MSAARAGGAFGALVGAALLVSAATRPSRRACTGYLEDAPALDLTAAATEVERAVPSHAAGEWRIGPFLVREQVTGGAPRAPQPTTAWIRLVGACDDRELGEHYLFAGQAIEARHEPRSPIWFLVALDGQEVVDVWPQRIVPVSARSVPPNPRTAAAALALLLAAIAAARAFRHAARVGWAEARTDPAGLATLADGTRVELTPPPPPRTTVLFPASALRPREAYRETALPRAGAWIRSSRVEERRALRRNVIFAAAALATSAALSLAVLAGA